MNNTEKEEFEIKRQKAEYHCFKNNMIFTTFLHSTKMTWFSQYFYTVLKNVPYLEFSTGGENSHLINAVFWTIQLKLEFFSEKNSKSTSTLLNNITLAKLSLGMLRRTDAYEMQFRQCLIYHLLDCKIFQTKIIATRTTYTSLSLKFAFWLFNHSKEPGILCMFVIKK